MNLDHKTRMDIIKEKTKNSSSLKPSRYLAGLVQNQTSPVEEASSSLGTFCKNYAQKLKQDGLPFAFGNELNQALLTNDALYEVDHGLLSSAIRKDKETLARVETDLEDVQRITDLLSKRRDDLQERIRKYNIATSALRRVPVEIWEAIFALVCKGIGFQFKRNLITGNLDIATPAYTLSQVSSRWRAIIHNIPRLWSRLDIYIDTPSPDIRKPLLVYLKHSATHPVDLTFELGVRLGVYAYSYGVAILHILAPHLARCRSLNIRSRYQDIDIPALRKAPVVSFPHLRTFAFEIYQSTQKSHNSWFWEGISSASPNLTELRTKLLPSRGMLPSKTLTELKVTSLRNPIQLAESLGSCQALQSLHLRYGSKVQSQDLVMHNDAAVLASLRSLFVEIDQFPEDLIPLFGVCVFPSLENVEIVIEDPAGDEGCLLVQDSEWHRNFIRGFRRSNRIRQLSLYFYAAEIPSRHVGFTSIFQVSPNITRLEIHLSRCTLSPHFPTEEIFSNLEVVPGRPVLLPHLTHLFILDSGLKRWTPSRTILTPISKFVISRTPDRLSLSNRSSNSVPLQVFCMQYCEFHEDNSESLGLVCTTVADIWDNPEYKMLLEAATEGGILLQIEHHSEDLWDGTWDDVFKRVVRL